MAAQARLKFLRMGPRKVRLLADLVKGQPVEQALDQLRYSPRAAAKPLYKLIRSAVNNADQAGGIDVDALYIGQLCVDQGPTMKRWRPRARGRASRILKRTSHVTVVLEER